MLRAKRKEIPRLGEDVRRADQSGGSGGVPRSWGFAPDPNHVTAADVPRTVRFGVYEVDLRDRELRRSGHRVRIQAKPFQVLEILLEQPGQLVRRADLASRLWPGLYVDFERSLNTAVNALRRVLRDSSRSPRFIETRQGHGYIFIGPVDEVRDEETRAKSRPVVRSLAVLPFETRSGCPERIAERVADDLIEKLSICDGLRVIAGSTSRRVKTEAEPRAAGQHLNVDAVVAGRVALNGELLTINTELLEVRSGWRMWGGRFEPRADDLAGVIAEVTANIAGTLRAGTRSAHATAIDGNHEQYLKGRYFAAKMTEDDLQKSIAHFQAALLDDPKSARAMSGLADSYVLSAYIGALSAGRVQARAAELAVAAVALDGQLAEAHLSVAAVRRYFAWDWAGAQAAYVRSLELNPDLPIARQGYASYLASTGRSSEATIQFRRALELDPLSLVINTEAAWGAYIARDFEAAIRQSWTTLAIEPRYAPAQHTLGLSYELTGMLDEAIVELENARLCSNHHPAAMAGLGHAYAAASREDEARKIADELEELSQRRYVSPFWRSLVYVGLGDNARALKCLEEALEHRDVWLTWLAVEPRFDTLREHPRFSSVLRACRG